MKKYKYQTSYRAYIGLDANGKSRYKRFTGHSNTSEEKALEDAKRQAERWKALHSDEDAVSGITLRQACESYIESKDSVLSPATIRGYWIIVNNRLSGIMNVRVSEITQIQIQREINAESKKYSPKTVHNDHGFLASVLAMHRPSMVLHTRLPQKQQKAPHVPSNDEIEALMRQIERTDYELYKALLLAAFGSLRRSEVCALTPADISGNVVNVNKVIIPDKTNQYVIKYTTKSDAGTRLVTMPIEVIEKLSTLSNPKKVVDYMPRSITKRFSTAIRHAGFTHFRFHDLRHYQASILHAMGVPDQYIMARGGWKTDATLKSVYRHQMDEKRKEVEDNICQFFEQRFDFGNPESENLS